MGLTLFFFLAQGMANLNKPLHLCQGLPSFPDDVFLKHFARSAFLHIFIEGAECVRIRRDPMQCVEE
jgi:hypothetical protein